MTAELPTEAPSELRKLDWSLRMPCLGEPIAVVGYSHLRGTITTQLTGQQHLEWERVLSVGVGAVLAERTERLGTGLRQSPGFSTDAPVQSGMSGGPVLDSKGDLLGFASSSFEPAGEADSWDSYVALAGPALELAVTNIQLGTGLDIDGSPDIRLLSLVSSGEFVCTCDESFDVVEGKATYSTTE